MVAADAEGRFVAPVQPTEGENRVEVLVQAVGGGGARSVHAVELDTRVSTPLIDRDLWR